jgi:tetratricopeptide (TPR) repeat protein
MELMEAEEQYKLALKADPNDVATHYNYGNLLIEQGRKEEAEEQYKLALKADPNHAATHSNYGILLVEQGHKKEAEEQYKLALKADPNHAVTHYNYGNLLKQQGRKEEAEEQYKLALKADPNHAATHSNYGNLLKQQGRKEEAEEQYKLALKADPNHAVTHSNYGNLLKQQGRKEEAEEQYKLALKADPNHTVTHYNYGILLVEQGCKEEAEEQYKLALKADPNHAVTHSNYGNLLVEQGCKEEAEEQYKLALKADPNDVATHSNYGTLLIDQGRKEEAEEQYKLALKADPNHAATHSNYGILLIDQGRKEEAEEQYKLALKADPNDANAHGAYGLFLLYINKKKKALKEIKTASQLFEKKGDNVMEHLTMAWFYEQFAEKYYKAACEKKKEKKKSDGYFRKSGKYAELAGDKYISASKYAEEKQKKLQLTKGYTLKGRSEIRKLEATWWEKIRLRIRYLYPQHYDIKEFIRMIKGIKNASEYYKKASKYSSENNLQCVACSDCMSILSSVLDNMLAVTLQQTVPKLEVEIKEWNKQLTTIENVYKESEKGEYFIQSLRKLILCIDTLEKYKKSTMYESKKSLDDCQIELLNIASNIEGPLQDIIKSSANKMERCKHKFILYTGGTAIKAIEDIRFLDRLSNLIVWVIKNPIKSLIRLILTIFASIIASYFIK